MTKKTISIILPAYNEADSIPHLEECMIRVGKENPDYNWEFLLVNDGSSDNTLQHIKEIHQRDSRFSYVDLSRNYGKEVAMMAGFDFVRGDATIIMDADMQHPISVIPEMIHFWEKGYDDVYAQRRSSNEGLMKRMTSKMYYRLLQKFTRIPIQKDTGDFRLLDRTCIEALKQMRESERNTKALYSWIGFRKKGIYYEQLDRQAGTSKWSFFDLLNLAIVGITSYTTAPLRIATFAGITTSLLAFLYAIFIIVKTLFYGDPVTGFPTLIVAILLLGGIQLVALGIIGEYLGRVFNETKERPVYFINSYNGERLSSGSTKQ